MIIERNDKKNTTTIYTAKVSYKTELVQDICRKNKNYYDKALYQLDNATLEIVRKLTYSDVFVTYVELAHSSKKLFVKGLNLSNIAKLAEVKSDGSVRFIK
jgi:hypothetical protein